MMRIDAHLAIVSDAPFVELAGRPCARPVECRVIETFAAHFRKVTLVRPRVIPDLADRAWTPLADWIGVRALREPGDRLQRLTLQAGLAPRNLPGLLADADAVMARLPCYEGVYALRFAVREGRVSLASLHGDWPEAYRVEWTHGVRGLLGPYFARRAERIYRRVGREVDLLFPVGESLRQRYAPQRTDAVVFGNFFLNREDLLERGGACSGPTLRLLFVGALAARKGVRHLLDACALLRERGRDVQLTLVGAGDQRDALAEQARKLDLAERVTFTGFLELGPELWRHYETHDVFVLPALGGEGCPNVVIEAMAKSCPVVSTRLGSLPWMIDDRHSGMLVDPGRPDQIAAAVEALADDVHLCEEVVRGGMRYAAANTHSANLQQIGDALRRALVPRFGECAGPE